VLAAIEVARERQQGAAAEAGFSRVEAESAARLAEAQAAAGLDVKRLEAERRGRESTAASLALDLERLERERRTRSGQARVREVKLLREAAALDGDIATADGTIRRLEQEIERRRLRAPVAGRLGQILPVRRGTRLREGERIAVVVPDGGGLRAIAEFPVAQAAGRIRAGQPARARLDGFPSTAWGSLPARVVSVGSEPRGGWLRVELTVTPDPTSRIPLQHGLPGQVEVEVERVSPLGVLARLAGRALMEQRREGQRFPITGRVETAGGEGP
jgi:membrane fusion protein (multidrug efflux system)